MSSGDKKRVQFRAPENLVGQADTLAAVRETDRTEILIDALREYLHEATHSDRIVQEIADAYYADEISFDELAELVGHEQAANFRVLKQQLNDEFVDAVAEEITDS